MDPSAPKNVAIGTAVTSASSALLSGIYGAVQERGYTYNIWAITGALNGAVISATFFTIREYAVSPLLLSTLSGKQYVRRRKQLDIMRGKTDEKTDDDLTRQPLTWSEIRSHKVLDTAIAGATTGGLLNGWKRGRAGISKGISTGAIVCTFLQLAYNELEVVRVKYVSRNMQSASSSQKIALASSQSSHAEPERKLSFLERVFDFFNMPKISDERYLAMLKSKRETLLEKIAALEEAAAEEKRTKREQEQKPAMEPEKGS